MGVVYEHSSTIIISQAINPLVFNLFFSYNVSFMILTYFLPMAIMTALYAAIGRELWGQKAIGEATAVQVESIKSKRRVSCNHYF